MTHAFFSTQFLFVTAKRASNFFSPYILPLLRYISFISLFFSCIALINTSLFLFSIPRSDWLELIIQTYRSALAPLKQLLASLNFPLPDVALDIFLFVASSTIIGLRVGLLPNRPWSDFFSSRIFICSLFLFFCSAPAFISFPMQGSKLLIACSWMHCGSSKLRVPRILASYPLKYGI